MNTQDSERASVAFMGSGTRKSVLACLIVIVALIFSSIPLAAVPGDTTAASSSTGVTRLADTFDGKGWDWAALADSDGFVDVIVTIPESYAGSQGGTDAAAFLVDDVMSRVSSEVLFEGTSKRFELSVQGFAARMTPEAAMTLEAPGHEYLSIYPDLEVQAFMNDSVVQIGADQVWSMRDSQGKLVDGSGVIVAVVDTGVDYTHPDLGGGFGPGFKVIGGYDFVNDDADPKDDNGHGTHVAGTIAANGVIKGVAPGASILAYKVLGSSGTGSMSDIILAIEKAMDPNGDGSSADRADIISMSLGGSGSPDDPTCQAVQEAIDAGIVVVVAAGNSGPSMGTVASPGVAPGAITVGAVDDDGVLADFSSRGTIPDLAIKPEVSAPGVNILSTVPMSDSRTTSPSGYYVMSGTSMATPHVSGGAALLLQMHPSWTPEQVKSAIVTGSAVIDESIWAAGAGELWLPDAIGTKLFFSNPLISYGLAGAAAQSASVQNEGTSVTFTIDSIDWYSLAADGVNKSHIWANISSISPSSMNLALHGVSSLTLTVSVPGPSAIEGYYDGWITLVGGSVNTRLPFGFAVLSKLTVHVLDANGNEIFDPYGGVWIYDVPDVVVALGLRGEADPCPPATFLLPSGTYNVHAAGHQLIYTYNDPYLLSAQISLARAEDRDVYLRMSEARKFTLDLSNDDGNPIYVKDFRMYGRYSGSCNVSFHLVGSDYSVEGSELFSLPTSRDVYISDTQVTVGVSIVGYSYTSSMWQFMSRNWDHWYEHFGSVSTTFHIEASTDLQYMLAWEFQGVSSSTSTALSLVDGRYSTYDTKYDIPGSMDSYWGDWGTHLATGAESTFYIRRDTDTSVNAFYSGMNRRTIVQGVFSSLYFHDNLFGGFFEREFYVPDYSHMLHAATASEIYLPDRNFLTPIQGVTKTERLGTGPFYPALWTENTDTTMALFQPILRDQSGAKVAGLDYPMMELMRGGRFVGTYQIAEFLARPDGMRIVDLSQPGTYVAHIDYMPTMEVNSYAEIEMGFTVPSSDPDPPRMNGLQMSQRFSPGQALPVTVLASDASAVSSVVMSWRSGASGTWSPLTVGSPSLGTYTSSIQTRTSDSAIDLRINVTDSSGNFLQYTATNASLRQIPVSFDLSCDTTEVSYWNGEETVVLSGYLRDSSGAPLNDYACVPLELTLNGRKIGMILDENMQQGSHSHDGTIRFAWTFSPVELFTSPNQTVQIDVQFDMGIYAPASDSFTLTSDWYDNDYPVITLVSPSNNSLIAPGAVIDLRVTDGDALTATVSVDGQSPVAFASPWDLATNSWADGLHSVVVVATDEFGAASRAVFGFDVDGVAPQVSIDSPQPGSSIPVGWTLNATISDDHLASVSYTLDGGPEQPLAAPYSISMAGWSLGWHVVVVRATDAVGNEGSDSREFEIQEGSVVISTVSPADGSVVRSGVTIVFTVLSTGPITSRWNDGGAWVEIGSATTIPTNGWSEGAHTITINSTDSLGGFDEMSFTLTIDDTPPQISLVSPANGSFVDANGFVRISCSDAHFESVGWTLWGAVRSSTSSTVNIMLQNPPDDGHFSLQVNSIDEAGNEASSLFVFAMDSQAPTLSAGDLGDGTAILPGQVIDVEVYDVFLTGVEWSLDDGASASLAQPYEISSTEFSLGMHVLYLRAYDASGKQTLCNYSFYVDGSPPMVDIRSPGYYVTGQLLEVTIDASDDDSVSQVVLRYALLNGSYGSVQADWTGSAWVAFLLPSVLWNNMTLYAVAIDAVGNEAFSESVSVQQSSDAIVPPGGDGDDPPAGDDSSSGFLNANNMGFLTMMASIIAVALLSLMYVSRDRPRKEEDRIPATRPVARPALTSIVSKPPALQAPTYSVSRSTNTATVFERTTMPKPVQTAKLSTIQPRQPERRLTPSIQQAPQQFPVVSPDQQRFRLGPEYQEMPDEDVPDLDLLTAELDDLAALAEKAVEKRMGFGREPRIEGKPLIEKPLRR